MWLRPTNQEFPMKHLYIVPCYISSKAKIDFCTGVDRLLPHNNARCHICEGVSCQYANSIDLEPFYFTKIFVVL